MSDPKEDEGPSESLKELCRQMVETFGFKKSKTKFSKILSH